MLYKQGLVSVIIPVYRTGSIIKNTIQSVLQQSYQNFEIIAIDDGSGDNTYELLKEISDPRLKVIQQKNQGMAKTRNNGLSIAYGEFILFLDHDDLIAEDFMSERIDCFHNNLDVGFVGGPIKTFPEEVKDFLSVAENVERELLFFAPQFSSTPSSYLIRSSILKENGIGFNTELSSTADRFFLLQLNKVTKGKCIQKGTLFYRISPSGFSQKINLNLILDNEKFYYQVKKFDLLPIKDRAKFKSLYFFMLAGGFRKVGKIVKMVLYLIRSFFIHPLVFLRRAAGQKGVFLTNQ